MTARLRAALEAANLDVIDAMLIWPEGANGPIAVGAYEALVRRLLPLRAALIAEIEDSPSSLSAVPGTETAREAEKFSSSATAVGRDVR